MNKNQKKIPDTWKLVTLDDIGIVVSGATPSTKEPDFWHGNIPWVTPADLSNFDGIYVSKGQRNISQVGLEYSSANLLPENSIIFSSRAPIGYVAIAKNELATNQGFKNLILTCNINSKYIYYYLTSIKSLAESMASGTTFLELSASKFKQIPFPLAPIEEQERIVNKIEEVLTNIQDSINNIDLALKKAELYVDKTIYKLFNGNLLEDNNKNDKLPKLWKWKTLNQIGEIYSGGTPSTAVQEFWGEDVFWITPSDLTNYKGKYISKGKKSISIKGLQNSSAKLLPPDSVLFSSRAPIGYVVISSNELSTNQGFKNIIPNADVNPSFLYYFLKSIKNYANKIASGTTFLELSTEKFKQIPFPLPPIDEQNVIVEEIDNAVIYSDNLIEELLSQRKKSEYIKEKLLQDAFLGKLSSQLETDSSVISTLQKIKLGKKNYLQNQLEINKIKGRVVREKKKLVDVLKLNFKKTYFNFDDIIKINALSIEEMEVEFKILLEKGIIVKQYDNISKSIRFKLI